MIKLVIKTDKLKQVSNPFGELYADYLCSGTYTFEQGRVYGLICEHGAGGESISLALSGECDLNNEEIYIDSNKIPAQYSKGWYVGKTIYTDTLGIRRECSVKKALQNAINNYKVVSDIDEVISMFHLNPSKLTYSFSNNSEWEMWRASLALGYVSKKLFFCFPWMNSLQFYDCMYNSSVFRFFNDLKKEGCIILLPTSKCENVEGLADSVIYVHNDRFEKKWLIPEESKRSIFGHYLKLR